MHKNTKNDGNNTHLLDFSFSFIVYLFIYIIYLFIYLLFLHVTAVFTTSLTCSWFSRQRLLTPWNIFIRDPSLLFGSESTALQTARGLPLCHHLSLPASQESRQRYPRHCCITA